MATPENCTSEEASGMPLVHPSKSRDSTTPQRFCCLLSSILIGVPSLESFLEIVEQEDTTKWRDLKRRLIARTLFTWPSCVLFMMEFAVAALSKPESPQAASANVSSSIGAFCATLSFVSGLGLVRLLHTIQPRTIKEIRSSMTKLTVIAMLLATPSLLFIMCMYTLCIGAGRTTWLYAGPFLKVVVIVVSVGVILFVPLAFLFFTCTALH
ncbi:hypothetical protein EDC04DRAFT_2630440 [Pisolithus marmoratus]|nr:hypothetical protein EDC04DRAFT_2630440 [Pisolithus marmoratus]